MFDVDPSPEIFLCVQKEHGGQDPQGLRNSYYSDSAMGETEWFW